MSKPERHTLRSFDSRHVTSLRLNLHTKMYLYTGIVRRVSVPVGTVAKYIGVKLT